jgi:hypothetical protein
MPYIPGTGRITDVYHSGNVFANGVQIALWLPPSNSDAFVLSLINSPTFSQENSINQIDGEEDEEAVTTNQQRLIKQGAITQYEIDQGNQAGANPAAADTAPPGNGSVPAETTGSVTVGSDIDNTLLYDSPLTGKKYYVKTVTKQPGVVFPYDVATVAPQNGLTVQQVCDNLRFLIINCFDPIKNKYSDAFMTCSFRANIGNGKSQHISGQACDIQYSSATKADYYTRALWIRDNIKFDQFLLEYKTTGTRNPWHHLSFNSASNRNQVLTFMNDKNCKGPGVTGLYDLSNT